MAYSYDFKDNVVYGADDINAIRTSILTAGVIEETDTSCKVVAEGDGVKIAGGQAVFSDGCRIAVDSEGVLKEITPGVVNYVYFLNNTLAGICEVVTETSYPEGDFVMLAEIDAEGNVSDRREFAQLKTADRERYAASFTASLPFSDSLAAGSVIGVVELPKSNCSLIEFNISISSNVFMQAKLFPKENNFVIWNYANGPFYSGNVMETYGFSKYRNFKFEVSGNKMTVILDYISENGTGNHTLNFAGVCMR